MVSGWLRRLRKALDAQYNRELDHLRERRGWAGEYAIQAPIRGWYAVHTATGTMIGPARNITALDRLILADNQSRPIRPRPVLLPLPEQADDATRADLPAWPYTAQQRRRDAS